MEQDLNKNKDKIIHNDKLTNFIKRLISGIFLVVCLIFILINGGDLLFFVCALLSIVALYEFFIVVSLEKTRLAFGSYLLTLFYYLMLHFYSSTGILLFLILFLILILSFYVFSYPRFNIQQVSLTFFAIIYVAVTFSFIYLIREKHELGKYFVWLIFISSWGCDTCAYCTGMLFGKHKLSEKLSPKKTIEGAVGGIVGAALIGAIYNYVMFYKVVKDVSFSCLQVAFSCAVGAIISMIGDLAASAIKRDFKVKDYGNSIPGHGGILDRFDSVIFTAPALYFILSI